MSVRKLNIKEKLIGELPSKYGAIYYIKKDANLEDLWKDLREESRNWEVIFVDSENNEKIGKSSLKEISVFDNNNWKIRLKQIIHDGKVGSTTNIVAFGEGAISTKKINRHNNVIGGVHY